MDGNDLITIGQLSTRAGVAASALRFYESLGLLTPAERSETNRRRYTRDSLRRVAFIRASQQAGLTLDNVKKALDTLPTDHPPTLEDWRLLTASWRPKLDKQIATLGHLRDGLDQCIGCGCMSLDSCSRDNPEDAAYRLGHGPRYWKGNSPSDIGAGS